MCKSVPQMEAARTRTSTSFGPIVGTGTFSRAAPRSGRGFLTACIVAVVILFCAGSLRRARNSSTAANAPAILVAERERASRSEEHTSELQSLRHLVCRLLLEK